MAAVKSRFLAIFWLNRWLFSMLSGLALEER